MSRRRLVLAGGAVAAACLLAVATAGWRRAIQPDPAPAPSRHPGLRLDLLADLRDQLVPSAAGGWVVAGPGEPWLEGWLLAAARAEDPGDGFDRALAEAEQALDRPPADDPDGRSISLALAEVLPGPGSDPARAGRLARAVQERATAGLDDGDATWLAVQIQLSAGTSPAADDARRDLATRAGAVGCDRLPPSGRAVPPPGASLTVLLRVLAAEGRHCPAAGALLTRALDDPAWASWVAASELADLAAVAAPIPSETWRDLDALLRRALAVGPEHPFDLGGVANVGSARRRLGLPDRLPAPVRHHLTGQVAARGGLPGRSTLAPTAFDAAVLRQLAGEGLVDDTALADTLAVWDWPSEADAPDPVVGTLLARRRRPRCADLPDAAGAPARVTLVGLVADQAWDTARAACGDRLDAAALVRRLQTGPQADQQAVRIATAEVVACRIDPALLDGVPGLRLAVTGPFATDPAIVWARSVAADPVAACAADG